KDEQDPVPSFCLMDVYFPPSSGANARHLINLTMLFAAGPRHLSDPLCLPAKERLRRGRDRRGGKGYIYKAGGANRRLMMVYHDRHRRALGVGHSSPVLV